MTHLPEKALLTVKEVSTYFGVTSRTIRNWIKSGKLRWIKKAGTLRIYRDSVLEQSEE